MDAILNQAKTLEFNRRKNHLSKAIQTHLQLNGVCMSLFMEQLDNLDNPATLADLEARLERAKIQLNRHQKILYQAQKDLDSLKEMMEASDRFAYNDDIEDEDA